MFKKLKATVNVGAAHILYHETATEATKNLARLQDVHVELCSTLGLTSTSEKSALLFILSSTRVEPTEMSDLTKFCNLLKRGNPALPPTDQPFLPYLSFITAPPRGHIPNKKRASPRGEEEVIPGYDRKIIQPPGTPRSHPTSELFDSLKRETNNGNSATLAQFTRALHIVDHTVDDGDIKNMFQQCQSSGRKKQVANNAALVEAAAPTMALVRQMTSSSVLVQQSLNWSPRRIPAAPRNEAAPK